MSAADPSALAQGVKETLSACAHRLAQTSGGKLVVLGPQDWHAVIALEQAIFPEDPWTPGMVAEELSSGLSVYFGVCADAPRGEGWPRQRRNDHGGSSRFPRPWLGSRADGRFT